MRTWEWFADLIGLFTLSLLAIALPWAAIERSRSHRVWARRRHVNKDGAHTIDWWVAMGAFAGSL